ncbi:MAG: hypothetical protein JXA52_05450 [Planctomycetes bacterium]|nr:hypothetical protein [Planctomycetota bacterium]
MNESLQNFVEEYFSSCELNRLPGEYGGGRIFARPLTGIARGDDKIFLKFKEVVGPQHLTPAEMWSANQLPGEEDFESRLRVVSIIFPYSEEIREAGKINKAPELPPEIYCVGRNLANPFMKSVQEAVVCYFQEAGCHAVASTLSPVFTWVNYTDLPRIYSTWSERHIAFAAGLGTFSLHEGMITEVGCNVRFASVITDAPLAVTERSSDEPYANCLYYANGTCRACIEKCPGHAITNDGHDKQKCGQHVRKVEEEISKRSLQSFLISDPLKIGEELKIRYPLGCALCQFDVPCMDRNPVPK